MLGPIASCPSNILNYLFFEAPTFWTTLRLINFFYGNGVPCSLAVKLFHACNDNTDALMSEEFYHFYDQYQRDTDTVLMGICFHMREEKLLFINGSNKDQHEIVESENHDITRGFGSKDTEALQNKIKDIRANVRYY